MAYAWAPEFGSSYDAPPERWKQRGRPGAGAYGLPPAFKGWEAASRYALGPTQQFEGGMKDAIDFWRGELGKDYEGTLMARSREAVESQGRGMRAQQRGALARAGLGGAGVSPMGARMLQTEEMARAGILGRAAQDAVLQAQAMRSQAAQGYQNALTAILQARMLPAYLQSARRANVPIAGGPSYVGPALGAAQSFMQAGM